MRYLLVIVVAFYLLLVGSTAEAQSSALAKVFDPQILGADLPYVERITGPARNTHRNAKVYVLQGCEITVGIANRSVRSLRLKLTNGCTFDLRPFLPNLFRVSTSANALTFGHFDSSSGNSGRYYADCLSSCGNAADPVVYEHWAGSHADGFVEVLLEVVQVDGPALTAANNWMVSMQRQAGSDFIDDQDFNCTDKFDSSAQQVFRKVTVSAITIGTSLEPKLCNR